MDEFFCIPGFAYFLFQLEVTPGARIRLLPENVDCQDTTFPFPWSDPIFNQPADYVSYSALLNPVFYPSNEYSALTFINLNDTFTFALRLGPYWQAVFGGCGSKIKVCVEDGDILQLVFFPSNELICCPSPEEEPLPPCDCESQVLLPFKITGFRPPDVDFSGYWFNPFFAVNEPCPLSGEGPENPGYIIPRWVAENGPNYATQWLGKVLQDAFIDNGQPLTVCNFGNGYIALGVQRNDESLQLCDTAVANCAGYYEPLPDLNPVVDNAAVVFQYYYGGPMSEYHDATGRFYCCEDLPPLPPCDCLNQVLVVFKITAFSPLDVNYTGYWLSIFSSIYEQCTEEARSGDIFIPRSVAEQGVAYATRWIIEYFRSDGSYQVLCDFGNGYLAFGAPKYYENGDETEAAESCDVPIAKCSGYYVQTLSGTTKVVDNAAVTLEYFVPGEPTEYHDTTSRVYCCDSPPFAYPPNYCLPPCGCERACDAVGCFDELAVRLKAGLTGFPAPGATVTVLVQEGHRKMLLTGVYDGTGVKITLTPSQKKFFVFFRAYSVAVFWNGQIWPMADGSQCKYFVAYPGPSQTTLTI